jgi:hypothetical protein
MDDAEGWAMGRTDVDRALWRSGEYFFEDGLCEIVVGLWIGLTVALPVFLLGWNQGATAWLWAFATGGLLRPAILAAKGRWVHPRTGRVAYPDPANAPPTLTSLGLSPADRPAAAARGYRATVLVHMLPGLLAVSLLLAIEWARRQGLWRAGHLVIGSLLSGALLFASWRWRQRRWIALAFALALLAATVASSRLDWERALVSHTAGITVALIASGMVAFVGYLRRAPKPLADTDDR